MIVSGTNMRRIEIKEIFLNKKDVAIICAINQFIDRQFHVVSLTICEELNKILI